MDSKKGTINPSLSPAVRGVDWSAKGPLWLWSYRMETKLNTRLFWQPYQPLASHFSQWCQYRCGATSLGIGLAQIRHLLWNYACSGFPAKAGQNLLGQSQWWFKLLCLKAHAQKSHPWRHSFQCRLTISLPRRGVWIYQMTQYQHVPSPPKQKENCQRPLDSTLATLRWQLRFSKESPVRHKFRTPSRISCKRQTHLRASVQACPFRCQRSALIGPPARVFPTKGADVSKNKATLLQFTMLPHLSRFSSRK